MGSSYCETILGALENGLDRRYAQLVRDCQYQHGHGGYSGTFAEKRNVRVIPPPEASRPGTGRRPRPTVRRTTISGTPVTPTG